MRDVERWHEWTPTVTSVRLMDQSLLAVGSQAFIRQPKLPPAKWRVSELDDAGRSFTWISRGPGVRVVASHGVRPIGGGSRATLSLGYTGLLAGLFASLTRQITERYLAIEAEGLKQRSEG